MAAIGQHCSAVLVLVLAVQEQAHVHRCCIHHADAVGGQEPLELTEYMMPAGHSGITDAKPYHVGYAAAPQLQAIRCSTRRQQRAARCHGRPQVPL